MIAKKIKNYITVAGVLFICCPYILRAQSQYSAEFTVSLGAGSSGLKYQINGEQSKSRFGGEVGVDYSHYFSKMVGISLGLEAGMFAGSINMQSISYKQPIETLPEVYGTFLLQADYTGFKEKQNVLLLQIPVMLRFQFPVSEKAFLFLGTGIKAGFPVSSKWNQNTATLTTVGYSEYTYQQYADMPNHGFSTFSDVSASGKLELKTPVLFALEGGLKMSIGEGKYLYTGVFLDYGLNDILKKPEKAYLLEYNSASPADYNYNSILTTNQYSVPGGIKPFAVGIKFKMGFGIGMGKKPEPIWCCE